MERNKHVKVNDCVTNIQIKVSSKQTKFTTPKHRNIRVEVGITNLVSLFMLKNYETYNTKIRFCKGGRWRYKLIVSRGRWHYTPTVSLKYKKSTAQRYERRRKGRPWRSKSTIQRYRNFRVAAGVTNLCCP